jgi:hypothetical protein
MQVRRPCENAENQPGGAAPRASCSNARLRHGRHSPVKLRGYGKARPRVVLLADSVLVPLQLVGHLPPPMRGCSPCKLASSRSG